MDNNRLSDSSATWNGSTMESGQVESSSNQQDSSVITFKINWSYLKSLQFVSLLAGQIFCLTAFIFVNTTWWCVQNYSCLVSGYTTVYRFFSTVVFITFLTSICDQAFYLLSIQQKFQERFTAITDKTWQKTEIGYGCIVCTFLFMVDVFIAPRTGTRTSFIGATVTGWLALMVFVARTCMLIMELKSTTQSLENEDIDNCGLDFDSSSDSYSFQNNSAGDVTQLSFVRFQDDQSIDVPPKEVRGVSNYSIDSDEENYQQVSFQPIRKTDSDQNFTVPISSTPQEASGGVTQLKFVKFEDDDAFVQ